MRRYRLSSLLFLIAISALICALLVQQRQARLREQNLRAELALMRTKAKVKRVQVYTIPVYITRKEAVPRDASVEKVVEPAASEMP